MALAFLPQRRPRPVRDASRDRPGAASTATSARRLAAALPVVLAGCAVSPDAMLPAYPALQPGQPWARMLMRAAVPANDRFSLRVLDDEAACQQPQLLMQGSPRQAAEPARLAAGKRVTLEFTVHRTGQTACHMRWSFTPRPDRIYMVQGMTVGDGCPAQLLDATQPERAQPPADLLLRSTPAQACVPLAQAVRVQAASPIRGGQVNGEAVLNPRATTADLEGLIRP